MSIVGNSVREFVSENPLADYESIVQRFGNPQQIAETCVTEIEPADLIEEVRIQSRVMLVICGVAILLVIMRFGFNMASYMAFDKSVNGYAVVEVVEITRETYLEGE